MEHGPIDRRAALRVIAVAGGLAWTAPAVQVLARPAFAEGTAVAAARGLSAVVLLLEESATGVVYRVLWSADAPRSLQYGPEPKLDGVPDGTLRQGDRDLPTLDPQEKNTLVLDASARTVETGPVLIDYGPSPDGALRVDLPEGVLLLNLAVQYGETTLVDPGPAQYRPVEAPAVAPGATRAGADRTLTFPPLEDTARPTPSAATGTVTAGG